MRADKISSRLIQRTCEALLIAGLLAIPFASAMAADAVALKAARSFSAGDSHPDLTTQCRTLESDDDCGAHQIGPAVTCFDSEGNPGEECILLETIAAETTKCVATESAESDRWQLKEDPVCALRIERYCNDGSCIELPLVFAPCCPTHELTGKACNRTGAATKLEF
jgi:hypothetical protein